MNVFEERIEIRRTSVSMDESRWMLSYLTRRRGAPVRRHNLEGDRSTGFSLQETRNMREKGILKSILSLFLSPFYFAPPSDSLRFFSFFLILLFRPIPTVEVYTVFSFPKYLFSLLLLLLLLIPHSYSLLFFNQRFSSSGVTVLFKISSYMVD